MTVFKRATAHSNFQTHIAPTLGISFEIEFEKLVAAHNTSAAATAKLISTACILPTMLEQSHYVCTFDIHIPCLDIVQITYSSLKGPKRVVLRARRRLQMGFRA